MLAIINENWRKLDCYITLEEYNRDDGIVAQTRRFTGLAKTRVCCVFHSIRPLCRYAFKKYKTTRGARRPDAHSTTEIDLSFLCDRFTVQRLCCVRTIVPVHSFFFLLRPLFVVLLNFFTPTILKIVKLRMLCSN